MSLSVSSSSDCELSSLCEDASLPERLRVLRFFDVFNEKGNAVEFPNTAIKFFLCRLDTAVSVSFLRGRLFLDVRPVLSSVRDLRNESKSDGTFSTVDHLLSWQSII